MFHFEVSTGVLVNCRLDSVGCRKKHIPRIREAQYYSKS